MTPPRVSDALRRQIRADAGRRCGYSQSPAVLVGMPLRIDHLVPVAAGGLTARDNLWPACRSCNEYKGDRTRAEDTVTREVVTLFNPRVQRWHDHFVWSPDGITVVGITPCDRVTISVLHLHNDCVVASRRFWREAGWWPPVGDPG